MLEVLCLNSLPGSGPLEFRLIETDPEHRLPDQTAAPVQQDDQ